ncbi:hypothetical protein [Flavobacterium terrigena]|uniref:Uncharacterized protein n=1 Tax=Flavobacterium terrigena TaxID=402734 RepID=A0A1H6SEF1_9FLAO|nr:hypothetical protein [Flavobacterium terrigena]SEI62360.1 hypothetical protein SAMN05660918_1187 [Flavobacterium terrigena]
MKQLNIPFKLGMLYDNWEFDLEIVNDRVVGCDIYIGEKFNKFLNYSTDKTKLIFSLDILEVVVLSFTNRNIKFYYELIKVVEKYKKKKINYHNNYLSFLISNNLIEINYDSKTKNITIIYGKIRFIKKCFLVLHHN